MTGVDIAHAPKRLRERYDYIQFIFIDLFCGAGGTTIGAEDTNALPADIRAFLKSRGIALSKDDLPTFKICKVVAAVNHDPIAIKSHWRNHPDIIHFEEDIRLLDPFGRLKTLIDMYRFLYPDAKIVLWASLECTNFSKAKGGEGRDQDSRTLAYELYRYIKALDPDYVLIENVVEFMAWGPMAPRTGKTDEGYEFCDLKIKKKKGKVIHVGPAMVPISSRNGEDWLAWRKVINSFGYHDAWKQINAADHGAMTSRNRLFGCFAKEGLPIVWPISTHTKKPGKSGALKKWKAVKHALDFDDEGTTIFNRVKRVPKVIKTKQGHMASKLAKKYDETHKTFGPLPDPLSTATMQRIFMGAVKHIAGGKNNFISRYNGGKPDTRNNSIDEPAAVITTNNRLSLIKTDRFLTKNFSGKPEYKNASIEDPSQTITGFGAGNLVKIEPFIDKAFGGDPTHMSSTIHEPFPTITTKPTQNKMISATAFMSTYNSNKPKSKGGGNNGRSIEEPSPVLGTRNLPTFIHATTFIQKYYSSGGQHNSVEEPSASITTKDRLNKVTFTPLGTTSVEDPAGAIVTNDKHSVVTANWLMNTNFKNIGSSIDQPSPVITADRHHHYLMNPSWFNSSARSVNEPCWVIVARQDKAPLGLITMTEGGPIAIPIYDDDCEWTVKLKEFMVLYDIVDIKMRMLKVPELKKIQGFPDEYILLGNQGDQKKFIGNSVCPVVPKRWMSALSMRLSGSYPVSLELDFAA